MSAADTIREFVDIADVRISADAIAAILGLWDSDHGTFRRSTDHKVRATRRRAFFPTVTFRCVSALVRACRYRPELVGREVREKLRDEILPAVVQRSISALSSSTLNVPGEMVGNPFTLALCVETLELMVTERELAPL